MFVEELYAKPGEFTSSEEAIGFAMAGRSDRTVTVEPDAHEPSAQELLRAHMKTIGVEQDEEGE